MFSPPKDYKVNGVVYEIDINNGFAKDGENLTEKLKGILKNDIVSTSIVSYNNKYYPVTCIGCSAFLGCDKLSSITYPQNLYMLH